jgi:hypothetical protein
LASAGSDLAGRPDAGISPGPGISQVLGGLTEGLTADSEGVAEASSAVGVNGSAGDVAAVAAGGGVATGEGAAVDAA